jgi:ATP/maltotriose-dependent transcriptional regulator MalT/predicted phosphodiesterase
MKNKLTWLHISDIHFHPNTEWRDSVTRDKLIDYIKTIFSESNIESPDFIFCTGDIAFGETKEATLSKQYEQARDFFDKLLKVCNVNKERLFVVAGNHDINRKSINTDAQETLKRWAKDDVEARNRISTINERFENRSTEFKDTIKRLDEYKQFIKDYLPHQSDDNGRHCYTKIIEIEELKVGIAGFNSAWTCAGSEDDRTIWLPAEWQFNNAQSGLKNTDIRIGLIHHPVDWFNIADRELAARRISTEFHFWLHGHVHDQWLEPKQNHIVIGAGAIGAANSDEFGINLVNIDLSTRIGFADLHKHRQGEIDWTIAPIGQHAPRGIWKFDLPSNLKIVSNPSSSEIKQLEENSNSTPKSENNSDLFPVPILEIPALSIIPTNIPKPRDYFTGREEELKSFSNNLTRTNLLAIEGLGGIGKTEFAAEYIKRHLKNKNVVWFDCETSDTLDALIAQAGYVDLLKGESKTDLAKYSGFVDLIERDQRFLFLDNFQEAHDPQFNQFFKFAERKLNQAKIVLISREHPKIGGILIAGFLLEGLDKDALAYAQAIQHYFYPSVQIDSDALAEICDDLKGHPLAIDFAFQLLSYGESHHNISQKIAEYKDDSQDLSRRLLAEVFEHPNSSEDEKLLLCQFAVFRGNVSKEAIAVINDNQNPMPVLSRLINKLMISVSEKKYQTHPLIREFCYQKLENPKPLHQKAAIYFQQSINDCFSLSLIEQAYYHFNQARDWQGVMALILQSAESLLITGHYQFLQTMMQQAEQQGVIATEFNLYYGTISQVKGEWNNALAYFKKVFSTESANKKIILEALNRYGEMLWRKGDYLEALTYFEQAYQSSENFDKEKADAVHGIGLIHMQLGDLNESEQKYQESLNVREKIGDKKGIAISLNDSAIILEHQGRFDDALKKHQKSLIIRQDISDKEGIARSLSNIAGVFSKKDNLLESLKNEQEALKIRREIGDKEGIAHSLNGLGTLILKQGNLPEALKKCQEALKIRQEIGDKDGIATSLNSIGGVLRKQNKLSEALKNTKRL